MWVFTQGGFYSAVQHDDQADLLVVRTRVKADARRLALWIVALDSTGDEEADAGAVERQIIVRPNSDYPWRVIVPREDWGLFLTQAVDDIDYGNYKDRVTRVDGYARADVYGRVWFVLLDLAAQDPERRSAGPYGKPWATPGDPWGTGADDPWGDEQDKVL